MDSYPFTIRHKKERKIPANPEKIIGLNRIINPVMAVPLPIISITIKRMGIFHKKMADVDTISPAIPNTIHT